MTGGLLSVMIRDAVCQLDATLQTTETEAAVGDLPVLDVDRALLRRDLEGATELELSAEASRRAVGAGRAGGESERAGDRHVNSTWA